MPYLPDQIAKIYKFPAGRLLNEQCVAIIELGGGVDLPALQTYCLANGYPMPKVTVATVDGAIPVLDGTQGADGEVDLDYCTIAAVAQGCQILVVFGPNSNQGFTDAILAAVDHPLKPCAISISWGSAIDGYSTDDLIAFDDAFKAAAAKKIQVFVASGDNGSNDNESAPIVDYPSASPYVIACGGTSTSSINPLTQKAWDIADGNGSTGGGFTTLYNKPSFQSKINVAPGRLVPDISGNADPQTGYEVNVDGEPMVIGGTSGVAPLYAALCALITSRLGQPVGNWQEVLYSSPNTTLDVVGGSNGAYNCVPGFDMCTGLGTVNGENLLAALAAANGLTVLDPLPPVIDPTIPLPTLPALNWFQSLLAFFNGLFGKKTAITIPTWLQPILKAIETWLLAKFGFSSKPRFTKKVTRLK